jgi:transposase-like protein
MRLLIALAVLLAVTPASAQKLYKWVDQAGKVHYSDQPPPQDARVEKKLEVRTTPAGNSASAGSKSAADLDMEFRKRQVQKAENEQKLAKEADANAEKQRNCTESKNRLAALERGGRITKWGPNGEQQFLSDEEYAREIAAQRKTVDSWCN